MTVTNSLKEQIAQLIAEGERRKKWRAVRIDDTNNGEAVVTLIGYRLPAGWNRKKANILFLVPFSYPLNRPTWFWAPADLRLASGMSPFCTGTKGQICHPDIGFRSVAPGRHRAFAWTPTVWHPSRDTLATFAHLIDKRLEILR